MHKTIYAQCPCVRWLLAAAVLALLSTAGKCLAQADAKKDVVFVPKANELDPDPILDEEGKIRQESKVWVLEMKLFFREVPLRSIKVNVPGRGERIYYYLVYGVSNPTSKPRTFVPNFDLVLQDTFPPKSMSDEILPKVKERIQQEIDPQNVLHLKSSVEIFKTPIPVQKDKPDAPKTALKHWTYGVAIWTGPDPKESKRDERLREKNRRVTLATSAYFSIFVSGLSNGLAATDHPTDTTKKVTRIKTLQINFVRKGDPALGRDEDVEYYSHRWIYRSLDALFPEFAKPKKP